MIEISHIKDGVLYTKSEIQKLTSLTPHGADKLLKNIEAVKIGSMNPHFRGSDILAVLGAVQGKTEV